VILDANVLLYAVDSSSVHHDVAVGWMESALNGVTRVGFPVQTLSAFTRIATHPRIMRHPLSSERAASFVRAWLDPEVSWVPTTGAATWTIVESLVRGHALSGNLVPDAVLAATAIEHGVPVASADSDFARFDGVAWVNPLESRPG
jgi:toxin-antitoxin system PIN domain toxin